MNIVIPDIDWFVVVGALCFITADFVTGVAKGASAGEISSSVMRKGGWHKLGSVLIIILAVMIDFMFGHIDLGFPTILTPAVCAYIILMEIASILENIGEINPELKAKGLLKLFGKNNE